VTVLTPLFILNIFTLFSFFLESSTGSVTFDQVLLVLAIILMAYFSFIPTIKAEISDVSYITFIDIIIISCLFTCLLSLVYHYFESKVTSADALFDVNFYISLGIFLFAVAISLLKYLIFVFKISIIDRTPPEEKKTAGGKFNQNLWSNPKLKEFRQVTK